MLTLQTFRIVGKQFAFVLAWIYIAASVARIVGWLWPGIRAATFFIIATFFVSGGIAGAIQQLRGGKDSTVTVALAAFGPLIVGIAIVLLLADIVSHALTPNLAYFIRAWGIMGWVLGYATLVRDKFHSDKLEADLKESSEPPKNI
jgi:hypothetical protein